MVLLLLGAQSAHPGSGAAITLIIPLSLLLVALVVWLVLFRRASRR